MREEAEAVDHILRMVRQGLATQVSSTIQRDRFALISASTVCETRKVVFEAQRLRHRS